MKPIVLFIIAVILSASGCSHPAPPPEGDPLWLRAMISTFEREPVGNPPQSIWKSQFHGSTVYYVPPQCCDQFGILYDVAGTIICAPDGGIAGHGDGRCADYFTDRTGVVLVWKDPRTR